MDGWMYWRAGVNVGFCSSLIAIKGHTIGTIKNPDTSTEIGRKIKLDTIMPRIWQLSVTIKYKY
jgi:hypothetical protein